MKNFPVSDTWQVDDILSRIGVVEKGVAIKALSAWVERGVLKDVEGGKYILLETQDVSAVPRPVVSRSTVVEEEPAVLTVQQQQAEQMQVYWRVRTLFLNMNDSADFCAVHRGYAH